VTLICQGIRFAVKIGIPEVSKLCHQINLSGDDSRARSFGSTDDSETDFVSIIIVLILLMQIILEP